VLQAIVTRSISSGAPTMNFCNTSLAVARQIVSWRLTSWQRVSHISSTAYCLSASHVLLSAAASILALSGRHALSANGGLRVHQDIRQHVVEVSVQALLATTRRCNTRPLRRRVRRRRDSRQHVRDQEAS
jgi:DMSO/TMAO reductase YedYZ heme-binding membrane subunit